jgi:calcineurin-like phosphoesterase family protein
MKLPIFFTSDWHDCHPNILEFCKRPFKDIIHMREVLIKNFNATVPENGTTYFLGDMSFNSNDSFRNSVIPRLNGRKILLVGNHDKGPHNMGFDAVLHTAVLYMGEISFSMSHCPLQGIRREDTTGFKHENKFWHGDDKPKNQKLIAPPGATYHLSGHIHSPNGGRSQKILGNQYDVGVDAHEYRPVAIYKIYSELCYHNKIKAIE